jgi:hypothetical protein
VNFLDLLRPLTVLTLRPRHPFASNFANFLLPVISILIGVWLASCYLTPTRPTDDGSQYVAMAHNIANYGVSTMDMADSLSVKPDAHREPVTGFIFAIAMRINKAFFGIPLSCLLEKEMTCADLLIYLAKVNVIIFSLTILGVYVGVFWVTRSKTFAFIGSIIVASNSILPSYVRVITSETPGALFFTWHTVFLYGAFTGRARLPSAIGSGLCLAALVLTKAIYFYWIPCLAAILIVAWWSKRGEGIRTHFFLQCICILVPAILISAGWVMRNYVQTEKFVISSDREHFVLSIRADYTTVTWDEYLSGYLYFTPYVGPVLAQKYFGDIGRLTYDYNEETSIESPKRVNIITRNLGVDATPEQIRHESYRVMLQNWEKQFALIPLMAYRGMFIGGCCNILSNDVPQYWITQPWEAQGKWPNLPIISTFDLLLLLIAKSQSVFTALLGPFVFLFSLRAVVKRKWSCILICTPVGFHFLVHAVATYFTPRFSVPVYPVMVILTICLIASIRVQPRKLEK